MTTQATSHYDRIGGAPAVTELVDRFYRLVLDDPDLRPYFGAELGRLKFHQAALLTGVLGGPDRYAGRDLGEAHRDLGVSREHYRKVALYLAYAMFSMGVPLDVIMAVGLTVAGLEDQIVAPAPAVDAA